MEYELEIKEGISFPLDNVEETDKKLIGADARAQLREVDCLSGPEVAEYGGEFPWIHQWHGSIDLNRVPARYRADEDEFETIVENVVESLMVFVDSSSTPSKTSADDFEWTVQVNKDSPPPVPDGIHSVLISWEPVE